MATPLEFQDVDYDQLRGFPEQESTEPIALRSHHLELGNVDSVDMPLESSKSTLPPMVEPPVLPSIEYNLFDRIVEHNLKYLRIVSKLGILPFDVDVKNRQVFPTRSASHWSCFYVISFICLVKTVYIDVTMVASLLNSNWFQVLQFPFHLAFTILASAVMVYLYLRPNVLRLSTVLLTEALVKRDRVKSFSRQQFILAAMPFGITTIAVTMALVFPFLTTIIYNFGTLLRVESADWISESTGIYGFLRVGTFVLDGFPIVWTITGGTYMSISHVLILEVLQSWCDELQSKTTRYNLSDSYRALVHIELIIQFFNQIYADIVFVQKVFGFSVGISAFVTVFWYGFEDNLVMGIVNLYGGIVCLMLYPLILEKAALLSGSMEMAKKSFLMATVDFEDEQERAFWRRRIESIRVVCILCGLRPVERESLPLFYDFFVSNFISVLLTT